MADFVQTMKDWRRMCKTYTTNDDSCCEGCPVVDYNEHGCGAIFEMDDSTDWQRYEGAIAAWAAEHPGPVYELWGEWFEKRGDLIRGWHNATNIQWIAKTFGRLMCTPIPADIAQKLGLQPKEG